MKLHLVPTKELTDQSTALRGELAQQGAHVHKATRDLGLQVVLVGLALTFAVLALAEAIRARGEVPRG